MSVKADFPGWVVLVVLGAVTFIILHIHFITVWEELYAVAPWGGFEAAARQGVIEPWFGSTPRSLRVTQTVLFVLAVVVALLRASDAMKAALALWVGVLLPLIPVLVARYVTSETGLVTVTPMSNEPISWLSIPLEALRTAAPILGGALAGLIVYRVGRILFGRG